LTFLHTTPPTSLAGNRVRRSLTRAGLLAMAAVVGLLALLPGPARAHSSSNSYLLLEQRGPQLVLRADLNLRDVDLLFDLDRDRDGQVTWDETAQRSTELQAWLDQGLELRSDAGSCRLVPSPLMASERADGFYLSAESVIDCAGGNAGLTLRYRLIFDRDNLHRGLIRLQTDALQTSAVLSPDQPEVALVPAGGASGTGSTFWRYINEGIWHIWVGLDHILFLLSLLLLAPLQRQRGWLLRWPARDALRSSLMDVVAVVTAFTVAHSITLALALTRVVEPPRAIVETLVALSVVLAALNNLMGWFALERWRMAFVFGLIHGFGFATALIDLNLPGRQLAVALGGFNLGVEMGQLAIVAAFFPLAWWLRMTGFYRLVVVAGGSLVIAAVGTLWVLQRLGLTA
jgi:hypothetical protein